MSGAISPMAGQAIVAKIPLEMASKNLVVVLKKSMIGSSNVTRNKIYLIRYIFPKPFLKYLSATDSLCSIEFPLIDVITW